jgi:hypothetical protein
MQYYSHRGMESGVEKIGEHCSQLQEIRLNEDLLLKILFLETMVS